MNFLNSKIDILFLLTNADDLSEMFVVINNLDLISLHGPWFPFLIVVLVNDRTCDGDLGLGGTVLDAVHVPVGRGHVQQTLQLVGVVSHVEDVVRAAGNRHVDEPDPDAQIGAIEHLEGRCNIMGPTLQMSLFVSSNSLDNFQSSLIFVLVSSYLR